MAKQYEWDEPDQFGVQHLGNDDCDPRGAMVVDGSKCGYGPYCDLHLRGHGINPFYPHKFEFFGEQCLERARAAGEAWLASGVMPPEDLRSPLCSHYQNRTPVVSA